MRKIKLSLDGLAVESFETVAAGDARRGTVEGFAPTPGPGCLIPTPATCDYTCDNVVTDVSCMYTCDVSCGGSCDYTCAATCAGTCAVTCDDATCVSCLTYCGQISCVIHCP